MSTYGKVEEGVVVKEMSKPKWFFDSGDPVDDNYLATEGILPIVFNDPGEEYRIKPMTDWVINETNIEKTFWTFTGEPPADYIDIIENIELSEAVGDTVITKSYTVTPLPLNEAIVAVKGYLADLRWKIETGGIVWNTNNIHTDRESQTKLFSSYLFSKDSSLTEPIKWKTMNGFIDMTNVELQNMGTSVKDFVEDIYNNESVLISQIENAPDHASLKTIYNNLDTSNWPTNSIFLA